MSAVLISMIRTAVPSVVGTVIAFLAARGLDFTADQDRVSAWLVPVCITGYYTLARLAEHRWPILGFLLGVPKRPSYQTAPAEHRAEHRAAESDVSHVHLKRKVPPVG